MTFHFVFSDMCGKEREAKDANQIKGRTSDFGFDFIPPPLPSSQPSQHTLHLTAKKSKTRHTKIICDKSIHLPSLPSESYFQNTPLRT